MRVFHLCDVFKTFALGKPLGMTVWKSTWNNNSLLSRPSLVCLYDLPLWQCLNEGQDVYGSLSTMGSSGLLSLHCSCLPRGKTLMKHPFPWSQPASPPSSFSTQAESEAFSYDFAKLIMLLYWFCEPLSHWGMCGGWAQRSQCASSNSLSSPGAFVLNLEASDQGWISKGQMCLHILSLMS